MEFLVTLVDFQVLQQHKIPRVLRVYYFTQLCDGCLHRIEK